MLQGSLRSGAAHRRAVFEVFARHLPHGRRYGVVAGTGRLLDAIERFRFSPADLDFLGDAGIVDSPTLAFLESYRFSGNVWGYSEGDCYFPGSPIWWWRARSPRRCCWKPSRCPSSTTTAPSRRPRPGW